MRFGKPCRLQLIKMPNRNFRIFDRRRLRTALLLGTGLFAAMLAVGYIWDAARPFLDPILNAGAKPFFWYFGGIAESGLPALLAVVIDDVALYAAMLYLLLTLMQYARNS